MLQRIVRGTGINDMHISNSFGHGFTLSMWMPSTEDGKGLLLLLHLFATFPTHSIILFSSYSTTC